MAKRGASGGETERERMLREAREATGADYKGKSWFREVFMYHYFRFVVIGVVALIIAGFFIYDHVSRVTPDFVLSVGTNTYVAEGMEAELKALIEDEIGDLNGDGKVSALVRVMQVDVENPTDALMVMQTAEAFQVTFYATEEYVLYLMCDSLYNRFIDNLEVLADYGIESERPDAVYAGDAPVLIRAGFAPDYWLGLRGRSAPADDETADLNYSAAVRVLNRILTTP